MSEPCANPDPAPPLASCAQVKDPYLGGAAFVSVCYKSVACVSVCYNVLLVLKEAAQIYR